MKVLFVVFIIIGITFAAPQTFDLNQLDKPFSVSGGGGHNPHTGTDLSLNGQARLWQSQNQRHEIHGQGSYGQHLGGPYGNSQPNLGGGVLYRYRF